MRNDTELIRRRKRSAVRGVALFAVFQLGCGGIFLSLCFIPGLPMWAAALFGLLAVFCAALVFPALAVLKQRFQEIQGGELDEARQY